MTDDLPDDTFKLPLPAFVEVAQQWAESTNWNLDDDALFQFIRALKAHPSLKGKRADAAYKELEAIGQKRSDGMAYAAYDLADEDGVVAFYRIWEQVRFPMGTDPVVVACGLAGDGLIRTQNRRPGRYERFLTVAALLQVQVRQKPILLPVRKLGEHMPCEPNTVSSWINWAMQDEVLVRTKVHEFRSQGAARAAEYVMGIHLWPDALPKLSALLGLSVRPQDVNWIEAQFAT